MRRMKKRLWLVMAILLLAATSSAAFDDHDSRLPVRQQVESFSFTNKTGGPVDSLVVTFSAKDVKTESLGVFGKAVSTDDVITLSKSRIADNTFATVTFGRDGAFEIKSWEWRVNGVSTGTHIGPPGDIPPGATAAQAAGGGGGAAGGGAGAGAL